MKLYSINLQKLADDKELPEEVKNNIKEHSEEKMTLVEILELVKSPEYRYHVIENFLQEKPERSEIIIAKKLSDKAIQIQGREILASETQRIYEVVKDRIKHRSIESIIDASLKLACDKHSCALNTPAKPKVLVQARRITEIPLITDARDRVDAVVSLLIINNYISTEYGELIKNKSKDIITQYTQKLETAGRHLSHNTYTLANSAVYLAGVLSWKENFGHRLIQHDLTDTNGISPAAIRDTYREIVRRLNLEFDTSLLR